MKITKINPVGRKKVYDISVDEVEHYVLENGVVTHNTGGHYSATNIFFISKSQEKDGRDLTGFTFKIKAEKSRYVREQSIFPMTVSFKGGINKYTGLLEIALDIGSVTMPKSGWYRREMFDPQTGEVIEDKLWRKKEINGEWWEELFKNSDFEDRVEDRFRLPEVDIVSNDMKEFDGDEEDE